MLKKAVDDVKLVEMLSDSQRAQQRDGVEGGEEGSEDVEDAVVGGMGDGRNLQQFSGTSSKSSKNMQTTEKILDDSSRANCARLNLVAIIPA
jgi:hypothetical protein